MGVTTADIDLSSLQDMIKKVEIGQTGRAFLLDKSGLYMADRNTGKVMKVNVEKDTDSGLAAIGKELISGKRSETVFSDAGGKNNIYFASIPETGWIVAVVMPQKELFQAIC